MKNADNHRLRLIPCARQHGIQSTARAFQSTPRGDMIYLFIPSSQPRPSEQGLQPPSASHSIRSSELSFYGALGYNRAF